MQTPRLAIKELERCVKELGLAGKRGNPFQSGSACRLSVSMKSQLVEQVLERRVRSKEM
jgi:hypothetical protein